MADVGNVLEYYNSNIIYDLAYPLGRKVEILATGFGYRHLINID